MEFPMPNRREFLADTLTAGAALSLSAALALDPRAARAADGPSEKVVVGIMGVNGRGSSLASSFAAMPGATVAYVCDVDERAREKCAKLVADKTGKAPEKVADFRRLLDNKSIDALVIAAPDHWHGPATILGCSADKHVYCEKPASHNAREGEMMVEIARKRNRVVQLGTQRRSMPGIREAIAKVHEGKLGKVHFSRGWYNNDRQPIGKGKTAPVPEWLDYALWQGPAPERPYQDNLLHYNWHWFWNWGTGELGNNGIHSLDVCRWGLGVDYPTRVTSGGGRYHYQDDQETPDTQIVTYDFGDKALVWEGRSCHRRGVEGSMFGMAFYGSEGSLVLDGGNAIVYDPKGKEVERTKADGGDAHHIRNFLECIKSGNRPQADIEEGHKSTLLCHLGNIAQRSGRTVNCDPKTGRVLEDKDQQGLWGREYRPGWEPKV